MMMTFVLFYTFLVFFVFIGALVAFHEHEDMHHVDTMAGDEGDD